MSTLDTNTRLVPPMEARQLIDAGRAPAADPVRAAVPGPPRPYDAKHRWEPGDERPTTVIHPLLAAPGFTPAVTAYPSAPPPALHQVRVPLDRRETETTRLGPQLPPHESWTSRLVRRLRKAQNSGINWGRR